jgi:hypothetical protein
MQPHQDTSGMNQIIDLLTQINNRMNPHQYNDPFIDGIHRNFPDLLYNNGRFANVQSVMEYINHQMTNNHNTYNNAYLEYWRNRPIPHEIPSMSNTAAGGASARPGINNIPVTPTFGSLFENMNNDILNTAHILNNLSNATTRTQTPVGSPGLSGHHSYMDDEFILNSFRTPPRPPRTPNIPPPPPGFPPRRSVGAREFIRTLIPDFLNITEPSMFMATARTYRIHPLTQLNEQSHGLTPQQITASTRMEQRTEGECPICYDDYSGNDLRAINKCNHAFHIECIDRWLVNNHTCPICRAIVVDDAPDSGTESDDEAPDSQ